MHKVLGSPTASLGQAPSNERPDVMLPDDQDSFQSESGLTHSLDSAQQEHLWSPSILLLSQQQAIRIKATAEAVLQGID